MACYHPLIAYRDPFHKTKNGKDSIKFVHLEDEDLDHRFSLEDTIRIPCGKCIGCRIDYSKQWANRLMLEFSKHDPKTCFFITLTYDDMHIGLCRPAVDPDTGESIEYPRSLEKKHLQDFMKRLRDAVEPEHIRFYACGEYGEKNHRCHFHLIVFNLHLPENDLHFLKKSTLGYDYCVSDLISEKWTYGFNIVAPVTWESCAYTARYMMKKLKGSDGFDYSDYGLQAPFATCSRKPGIAKAVYDDIGDFSKVSNFVIGTSNGVRKFPAPAYFEKLFAKDFPEQAEIRKKVMAARATAAMKAKLSRTDLAELHYDLNEERRVESKINSLQVFRDL